MNASAHDEPASGFDDAALGRGLAPEVEALIARAGRLRDQPAEAEALLRAARALAPEHPAPLIALHRFHFYGHRLHEARLVAEDALAIARTALGPDFGDQPPSESAARFDAAVRFYLFVLKGHAYLSMRLGEFDRARATLAELRRLDPQDRVGGALLAQVLARQGRGEDDGDDVIELSPAAPRGWSPAPRATERPE